VWGQTGYRPMWRVTAGANREDVGSRGKKH